MSLASPGERFRERQRSRRGHNFYPSATEMAAWPELYSTEDVPAAEKKVMAHYFQGPADCYVVEYDANANEAFGYADLGLGHPEWGYVNLGDVEQLRGQTGLPIERDLDFEPGTSASKCIPRYVADAAAAGDKAAIESSQDRALAAIVHDALTEQAGEAAAMAGAEQEALALEATGPDDIDFGWDGPDAEDPMGSRGSSTTSTIGSPTTTATSAWASGTWKTGIKSSCSPGSPLPCTSKRAMKTWTSITSSTSETKSSPRQPGSASCYLALHGAGTHSGVEMERFGKPARVCGGPKALVSP